MLQLPRIPGLLRPWRRMLQVPFFRYPARIIYYMNQFVSEHRLAGAEPASFGPRDLLVGGGVDNRSTVAPGAVCPAQASLLAGGSETVTPTVVTPISRLQLNRQSELTQDPLIVTSYRQSSTATSWSGSVSNLDRSGTLPQYPGTGLMVPSHVSKVNGDLFYILRSVCY